MCGLHLGKQLYLWNVQGRINKELRNHFSPVVFSKKSSTVGVGICVLEAVKLIIHFYF